MIVTQNILFYFNLNVMLSRLWLLPNQIYSDFHIPCESCVIIIMISKTVCFSSISFWSYLHPLPLCRSYLMWLLILSII